MLSAVSLVAGPLALWAVDWAVEVVWPAAVSLAVAPPRVEFGLGGMMLALAAASRRPVDRSL